MDGSDRRGQDAANGPREASMLLVVTPYLSLRYT